MVSNLFRSDGRTFAASSSSSKDPSGTPASSSSRNGQTNGHQQTPGTGIEDEAVITYLEPTAYPRNGKAKWKASGRGTGIAVSPVGGEVASYMIKSAFSDPNKPASLKSATLSPSDKVVYFSSPHALSNPVIDFYAETYTLFQSLQRIVATGYKFDDSPDAVEGRLADALLGPPGSETIGHMSRLIGLYEDEAEKLRDNEAAEVSVRGRIALVFQILRLVHILFLPRDGRGEGLVGEELLDWVNEVDPAPDNRLGNEIMQSRPPWDHPAFWPYLSRCLLRGFHQPATTFLRSLTKHPHQPIAKFADLLATHLAVFPRSSDVQRYPLDHQFLSAHKTWVRRLKAEIAAVSEGKEVYFSGIEWAGWNDDFRIVVELLQGQADRVLEDANDWREAIGAWGVLVDVGLRRDDLPSATEKILEQIPVDENVLDDTIQSHFCEGKIYEALFACHELDTWLTAHLADIFDKLVLLPDEEAWDVPLRDYFLLRYAEMLGEHPNHAATWRIVVDYLQLSGPEGRARLKEYILHVSLGSIDQAAKAAASAPVASTQEEAMEVEEDSTVQRFEQYYAIREICAELQLEEEWRTISRIMAHRLIRTGNLGIASTVYAAADDLYGLARIADKLSDLYVDQGEEAFLEQVEQIPPTLLREVDDIKPDLDYPQHTIRMVFIAQFRDFILFRQQEAWDLAARNVVGLIGADSAPVGFRAVLLVEAVQSLEAPDILIGSTNTFEIMRILEDVIVNASHTPETYLGQLERYLKRIGGAANAQGAKDAVTVTRDAGLRKLEEVRLACARNLARAMVLDVNDEY